MPSKTIAPTTARPKLARLKPVTPSLPHTAAPIHPPTNAPAIPSSIVTIHPPGSRPGISSFATAPANNPKTIHARMFIESPSQTFASERYVIGARRSAGGMAANRGLLLEAENAARRRRAPLDILQEPSLYSCRASTGGKSRGRNERTTARHPRSAHLEDAATCAHARLGHLAAAAADFRRGAPGTARFSLPGAASPREPRLDQGGVGAFRQ